MEWTNIITLGTFNRWQNEAISITKSLGLVYSERNPPPSNRKIGDELPASTNAIAHAYVSAKIAQNFGPSLAKNYGDWRELNLPPGPGEAWDTYKDLWNNEVGRRIGIEAGFFGDSKVIESIKNAMRSGDLIVVQADARVPSSFFYSSDNIKNFDINTVKTRTPLSSSIPHCFLSGTPILMADGSQKSIEKVELGDLVLSFDVGISSKNWGLVPRQIMRMFRNETQNVIDLRGLRCTSGHIFLTNEVDDQGNKLFKTIAVILKEDSTIVHKDETVIRARTGALVGSIEDLSVLIYAYDHLTGTERQILVRAGIPVINERRLLKSGQVETRTWSLVEWASKQGVDILTDGTFRTADGRIFTIIDWPSGSTPYDTYETQNWVVSTYDGKSYTPPWIADLADEDERTDVNVVGEMPGFNPVWVSPPTHRT